MEPCVISNYVTAREVAILLGEDENLNILSKMHKTNKNKHLNEPAHESMVLIT